jgi:8-oxo-dGTP diphosphatase
MNKFVKVVAAIIENDKKEILCALRSPEMSNPNRWEFPGGKVETNENVFSALVREINEELKCQVETSNEVFHEHLYRYENFAIQLISIKCKITNGVPTANEHSKLIWLKRENLESLKWAPADIPVVREISKEI